MALRAGQAPQRLVVGAAGRAGLAGSRARTAPPSPNVAQGRDLLVGGTAAAAGEAIFSPEEDTATPVLLSQATVRRQRSGLAAAGGRQRNGAPSSRFPLCSPSSGLPVHLLSERPRGRSTLASGSAASQGADDLGGHPSGGAGGPCSRARFQSMLDPLFRLSYDA